MTNQHVEVPESTTRGMAPGQTADLVFDVPAGDDVSNDLSIVINTISDTRRRSTRMPRMLLPFPRFRRYS